MQVDTQRALTSLLGMAGVEGTFLVNSTGAVEASNLPAAIDDDVLDEASTKLARLRQAFATAGHQLDFCTVRFAGYKLCIKASGLGTICVLTRPDVNVAALRLALKLMLNQLERGRS